MKKNWKLSASFISSFKACPTRCYHKYVLGLVPIVESDALRMGTSWHALLEIAKQKVEPGVDIMDIVTAYLNKAYENRPTNKVLEDWAVEQTTLLYSLCGYRWVYQEDNYEVLAEEVPFEISVKGPSGRALPNVILVGKIDKITRSPNGVVCIDEHKSTSDSLDSDSSYWKHLNLDTQTRLYPYAAQRLQLSGELEKYGITAADNLISTVRYDVWRKPSIRPKMLTQTESAEFVKTGEYCGEKFELGLIGTVVQTVNNSPVTVEPGKKEGTFAIRETPDMFGARLLQDISTRPEFYFARRELSRTTADLAKFEVEVCDIYHTIKFMERNNTWWVNEKACEAMFKCEYCDVCYNCIDVSQGQIPLGYKCIFGEKHDTETE